MNEDIDKLVDYLDTQKSQLTAGFGILDSVVNAVGGFVDRYYSNDSVYKEKLKNISGRIQVFKMLKSETSPFGDTLNTLKNELEKLIENIIREINSLGLPKGNDLKIDKSVNVHTSVNQTQSITLTIDILTEAIKDELTGKQLKQIKELIKNEKDPLKNQVKIADKLKEFGNNLSSNIMASLLTNPAVWSNLFGS